MSKDLNIQDTALLNSALRYIEEGKLTHASSLVRSLELHQGGDHHPDIKMARDLLESAREDERASSKERKYCCALMEQQLTYSCAQHSSVGSCPDILVLRVGSGYVARSPNADYLIHYCPFCGASL